MSRLSELRKAVRNSADPERAKHSAGYFKTGPGEYGEGDVFLGLTTPQAQKIEREFLDLAYEDIEKLLASKVHEERVIGVLILVHRYEHEPNERKNAFDFYLANRTGINNWDLVDISAPKILGDFMWEHRAERKLLDKFVISKNIWERRMAVLATFAFIREGEFEPSLALAEKLVRDEHDLMHKAVGWMLREIGKRDQAAEEKFLKRHCRTMPRTMLRYAIERMPEAKRKAYLAGKIA